MTAKNTRVKARVKAEALREYITVNDKIFVMGHTLTDCRFFWCSYRYLQSGKCSWKKGKCGDQ